MMMSGSTNRMQNATAGFVCFWVGKSPALPNDGLLTQERASPPLPIPFLFVPKERKVGKGRETPLFFLFFGFSLLLRDGELFFPLSSSSHRAHFSNRRDAPVVNTRRGRASERVVHTHSRARRVTCRYHHNAPQCCVVRGFNTHPLGSGKKKRVAFFALFFLLVLAFGLFFLSFFFAQKKG